MKRKLFVSIFLFITYITFGQATFKQLTNRHQPFGETLAKGKIIQVDSIWIKLDTLFEPKDSLTTVLRSHKYHFINGSTIIINDTSIWNALSNCDTNGIINASPAIITAINQGHKMFLFQKGHYKLSGSLHLPANSTLIFYPNSWIHADSLFGNNTSIQGDGKIFDLSTVLAGKWNIDNLKPEWFGAKSDGNTDDILPLNKAINEAYAIKIKTVLIPRNTKINSPVIIYGKQNLEELRLLGNGKSGANSIPDLVLNTGNAGIKIMGSQNISLVDLSMCSDSHICSGINNPSTIGLIYERTPTKDWCSMMRLDNIMIHMHTDSVSNRSQGTIGIYNCGGENHNYNNIRVYADQPIVITKMDVYSRVDSVATWTRSVKDIAISGHNELVAWTSHCLTLEGIAGLTIENLYVVKFPEYYTSKLNYETYPIYVTGVAGNDWYNNGFRLNYIDVEGFAAVAKIDAKLHNSQFVQGHVENTNDVSAPSMFLATGTHSQIYNSSFNCDSYNGTVYNFFEADTTSVNYFTNCTFYLHLSNQHIWSCLSPLRGCNIYSEFIPTIHVPIGYLNTYTTFTGSGIGMSGSYISYSYGQPDSLGQHYGNLYINSAVNPGTPAFWLSNGIYQYPIGQIGNRWLYGSPLSVLRPTQNGEIIFDYKDFKYYKSYDTTNISWVVMGSLWNPYAKDIYYNGKVSIGGGPSELAMLDILGADTSMAGSGYGIQITDTSINAFSGGIRDGISVNANSKKINTGWVDITRGLRINNPTLIGNHRNLFGITIDEQTGATNNTDLYLGGIGSYDVPLGNWALYSKSTRNSYLNGSLEIKGHAKIDTLLNSLSDTVIVDSSNIPKKRVVNFNPELWTSYQIDTSLLTTSFFRDVGFTPPTNITIDSIGYRLIGGAGSPSVTPKPGYGTNPSSLTYIISSPSAVTSNTAMVIFKSLNNPNIPKGSTVFLTFSAIGSSVKSFAMTIYYH